MNKQRKAVYDMRRMVLEGKETREYVLSLAEGGPGLVPGQLRLREGGPGTSGTWRACRAPSRRPSGWTCPCRSCRSMGRDEMADLRAAATGRYDGQGAPDRPGADAVPPAHDHAADRGHTVEGPPLQPGPPEGRHRPARLRPARPARRVQEGVLQHVPGADGPHRRGDPAVDLPVPAGAGCEEPTRRGAGSAEPGGRGWRRPPLAAREPEPPRAAAGLGAGARRRAAAAPQPDLQRPHRGAVGFAKAEPKEAKGGSDEVQTIKREGRKVGRNDPCPCGSGKKYKKCHGSN